MPNTFIHLPYGQGDANKGKHSDGFWTDALKRHLKTLPDKGFPIGGRLCLLLELPEKESLDYWLRDRYARYPDIRQSVADVQNDLIATGDFVIKQVENGKRGRNPEWIYLVD